MFWTLVMLSSTKSVAAGCNLHTKHAALSRNKRRPSFNWFTVFFQRNKNERTIQQSVHQPMERNFTAQCVEHSFVWMQHWTRLSAKTGLTAAFIWDLTQWWISLRLKIGPIECPETSVTKYHSTLHIIVDEGRYHGLLFYGMWYVIWLRW